MTGMNLRGMEELLGNFRRLIAASRGPEILTAVQSGALVIRRAHIQRIRRTPSKSLRRIGWPIWLSGNLGRSSHIEPGPKPSGIKRSSGAGLGAPQPSTTRVVVHIGTDVDYAKRLEYGFSGQDSLGRTYNQPPNPTLRPAFDESKDRALAVIGRDLGRLMRQAVRT